MIHIYFLGGLFSLPIYPTWERDLENQQQRRHLDDPHLIIIFSTDPFKLPYPLAWLIVILV